MVIAQLIVIVLVLHALRAVLRFAAAHARPDALLALAVTDLAKTLVHIIVFLTPGHKRNRTELADGKVRLVLRFHFIDDLAVFIHLCGILPCDHTGIRLEALCDRFALFIDSYTSQLLCNRAVACDQIRNIAGPFNGDICIRRILCRECIIKAVRRDRAGARERIRDIDRLLVAREVNRSVIQLHIPHIRRLDIASNMDHTVTRSIDIIDKAVARHVPRSTVSHGELKSGDITLIWLSIHFDDMLVFTVSIIRFILLISAACPRRAFARQVHIYIGINNLPALVTILRCSRCSKNDIPVQYGGVLSVCIDIRRGVTAYIQCMLTGNRCISIQCQLSIRISNYPKLIPS